MPVLTIDGVFRNGQVILPEIPSALDGAKVRVTFLDDKAEAATATGGGRMMTLGMFAGPELTSDEDLAAARYRAKAEPAHGG